MRVLVQRVSEAKVEVDGNITGQIGNGLLVLLGITHADTVADADWLIRKLIQLRIFRDEEGKMNRSVQEAGGGILIVSQFTLYADYRKGNRPSYIRSAPPAIAIPLYEAFIQRLRAEFSGRVECGIFGADMKVSLLNDGPVTLMMDSANPDA